MIDKSCLNYDGGEDCNKCCKRGYIFSCPSDCPDYKGFFPHDRKEQGEKQCSRCLSKENGSI